MALNVNRSVEDTFYRYKMPRLIAKVEGKGNGIKTVVVNMVDVAKALSRKASYPTKFFGCELGAQVYCDEKNDRYIVNGSHDANKLQELLDGFIKKYVLCSQCDNPETTLSVKKKPGIVMAKCKACGAITQLDAIHRLTTFIIKNPPRSALEGGKDAKGKEKVAGGEEQADDDNEDATTAGEGGDEGVRGGEGSDDKEDDDDDWAEETTEEARRRRMEELSDAAKAMAVSDELEMSEKERADHFFALISDLKNKHEVLKKIVHIKKVADNLDLGANAVLILTEVLLSRPAHLVEDMTEYQKVFQVFTRVGDEEMTTRAQKSVLAGLEMVIRSASAEAQLVAKSCRLLKQLYDLDIVQEEAVIIWFEKTITRKSKKDPVSAQIRDKCAPMIEWLKTAESEESEDEEDDDDEVEHSDGMTNGKDIKVAGKSVANGKTHVTNGNEEEDEVDIDAI